MGLFKSRQPQSPQSGTTPAQEIPISHVDLSKRYNVYCSAGSLGGGEERLYEDVRFLGIRTFDRITEFGGGYGHSYLEIEAPNGSRMLLPHYFVLLICEHGTQPVFKVLRQWGNPADY